MKVSQIFSLIHDHENADDRIVKYDIFRTILDNKLVDKADFVNVIQAFPDICHDVANENTSIQFLEVYKNLVEVFTYPEIQKEYSEVLDGVFEDLDYDEEEEEEEEEEEDDDDDSQVVRRLVIEHNTHNTHNTTNSISTIHFVMTCFTAAMAVVNTIGLLSVLNKYNI